MKNQTREIILDVSRRLFNELGVYHVTLRQIALEMGISQGNLNYHFKKKEDIIKELYHQSVNTLTKEFIVTPKLGPNFYFLFELARKTFEVQIHYKFLVTDIHYIENDIAEIKEHHALLKTQRINEFNQMFKVFIGKGYMRKAEYKTEYEELGLRLIILGIYSTLEVDQEFKTNREKGLKKYMNIIMSTCYPYLTKEGKKKYLEILKEMA